MKSPNNYALSLYSVYRQEIPWRLFLLTAKAPMREFVDSITVDDRVRDSFWNIFLERYFTEFRQKVKVQGDP